MRPNPTIAAALAALSLSACGALGLGADEPESPYPWESAEDPADVPLLARDGGRVDDPVGGSLNVGAPPRHGVQTSTEGRMYIVELYQQALDERDALRGEVLALSAALGAEQQQGAELAAAFEAERAEGARLSGELESLASQNFELAARLATAQLRRLEAEKLLLEARLGAVPQDPAALVPDDLASAPAGAAAAPKSSAWDLALEGGGQ